MSNTNTENKRRGDTGASEGQAVPTSGKRPAMLHIYLKVSAAIEERTIWVKMKTSFVI